MVTSERGERDLSKGEEERAEASYMERDWQFRAQGSELLSRSEPHDPPYLTLCLIR